MHPVLWLVYQIIDIVLFLLVAHVILGLLISFGIVNSRQPVVYAVKQALERFFEPILAPLRRILPNFGVLDVSPIILALALQFIVVTLRYYFG